MIVADLLTQLQANGQLGALYSAGCVNTKTYNYLDIFRHYQALRQLPRYVEAPGQAVREVMRELQVSRDVVYKAIKTLSAPVA